MAGVRGAPPSFSGTLSAIHSRPAKTMNSFTPAAIRRTSAYRTVACGFACSVFSPPRGGWKWATLPPLQRNERASPVGPVARD